MIEGKVTGTEIIRDVLQPAVRGGGARPGELLGIPGAAQPVGLETLFLPAYLLQFHRRGLFHKPLGGAIWERCIKRRQNTPPCQVFEKNFETGHGSV